MKRLNTYWAFGCLGLGCVLGLSVMVGYIPGAHSSDSSARAFADFIQDKVDVLGHFLTGLGIALTGLAVGALCLVSGEGATDVGLSGGDCGGDGGGD
ncbi:MAG: hypothetical protein ACU0GG_15205 [Paracoccaceae bacterium]